MGALAAIDYLYQRWRTDAQLRMSRHEVKEEMREQEGDPHLKSHLKSLRQKMSRRRMTAEVAKADVIITNPTELADRHALPCRGNVRTPRAWQGRGLHRAKDQGDCA